MRDDVVTGAPRWSSWVAGVAMVAGSILALPSVASANAPADVIGQDPQHSTTRSVGTLWGDANADRAALNALDEHTSLLDPGSLFALTKAIGARSVWSQRDAAGRAITGQGVTVAVLDSGVEAVPGLDAPRKIVRGPDLSLEANSTDVLADDTFGHGTHMAGIIAAKDPATTRSNELDPADSIRQLGVAPDAQLLALKLAATDGSADVSQIIAALDWVSQHRTDDGMNVRVVNLSFGTASVQPYQLDPLAAAAEHAWHRGLVVVVSGGNGGADAGTLTDPAIDPYVIAVGASDPQGTTAGWASPSVADFSSRGTAERHVDLVAPGRSIASLRAPGSFVDRTYPEGRVAGDETGRLFRGSGTSQAAAVVSGAAALVLQANPNLGPDQVKDALLRTARSISGSTRIDAGAGQLDVLAAVAVAKATARATAVPVARARLSVDQSWPMSTGAGSLDAARGGSYLVDPQTGEVLSGEVDVVGTAWDPAAWSQASSDGTSWDGGEWMSARWSGDGWTSTDWASARWSSARWSSARWSSARWSDGSWDSARWSRARWSGVTWESARWSSARWS
ncbi:S8 family serine peptidase [Pengzhenrongella sp.]|jgi:serine protease AprX|uniref:S8 family serine peptidase n=1 Tax=Pengzhenrongella sp. TaxID=2888820 RepID=UPI002F92B308